MTIASQILEQLGGQRFIAMTGSKNLLDCGNALQMHLTRNQMKARYLTIELTPMDTYKMVFSTVNKNMELVILDEIYGVYFDQLQDIFTMKTGLYTSLGTMGRN